MNLTNFTIDHFIFFSFLIINIIFGLRSSRGITTLTQYSIGDRNFSTPTLVSTLVATWICGEFFVTQLTEIYRDGLFFIIPALGNGLFFFLTGYVCIPRMKRFIGNLSIAEAMGNLYGRNVRLVTSVSGFICAVGIIAVQLKVAGAVFEYVLNINSTYGIIIAGTIITAYSVAGGIKSVVHTDVVQFLTFGTIIPLIAFYFFIEFSCWEDVRNFLLTDSNYDLKNVLSFTDTRSWTGLFYVIVFAIPGFDPGMFQRITISRNVAQASRAYIITGFIIILLVLVMTWLAIVMASNHGKFDDTDLLRSLFDNSPPIYKGLLLVGITAMVMSTVDSYINASSVLIAYDFVGVFTKLKNELYTARLTSFLLGTIGIIISLNEMGIFQLFRLMLSFYLCTVSVPFLMAIFSIVINSNISVLIGIFSGGLFNLMWILAGIKFLDGAVPAMIVNFLTIIIVDKCFFDKKCEDISKEIEL